MAVPGPPWTYRSVDVGLQCITYTPRFPQDTSPQYPTDFRPSPLPFRGFGGLGIAKELQTPPSPPPTPPGVGGWETTAGASLRPPPGARSGLGCARGAAASLVRRSRPFSQREAGIPGSGPLIEGPAWPLWAAQSRNRLGPPGGFEYLYVSYDPCSDGVPSAGCLARVLSVTRDQLSESFSQNIFFARRRKSLRE